MKSIPWQKIILVVLYILGIALVSTLAILIAAGYRYNIVKNRVFKVSVVHLVSDPVANIKVNNLDLNQKTPKAFYLEPGDYNISLTQDGYQDVNLVVTLGSGELYEIKNLVLFKNNIIPKVVLNQQVSPNSLLDESLSGKSDLFIANQYEIWAQNKLVTRLSAPIRSVIYYDNNQNYIIYQTDTFVGLIGINGRYNQKLFDYNSDENLHLAVTNRGHTLVAKDSKNTITAEIN